MPLLYAENHDPEPHPDPKRFDIDRPDQSHISFGGALLVHRRPDGAGAPHQRQCGARAATSSAHFRSPRQKRGSDLASFTASAGTTLAVALLSGSVADD
jgi:hypothetical protein